MKELIHNVLHEKLTGISYNQEESTELTKQLSDEIKSKLKGNCAAHSQTSQSIDYDLCLADSRVKLTQLFLSQTNLTLTSSNY